MENLPDDGLSAICSVTEMARKLGLSRARFYQLLDKRVFPPPIRCDGRRPFYPLDLQRQCMEVRATGIGADGQPVLFNKSRKNHKSRRIQRNHSSRFVTALKNIGLDLDTSTVEQALHRLYPDGLEKGHDKNRILLDLARHFAKECPSCV